MYHNMWYNINMPNIIPLRQLKDASNISNMAHENNEPIFVTKNGKSDLVIMSSECYDQINKAYKLSNDNLLINEPSLFNYVSDRDSKKIYSIAEIKQTLEPIFKKHKVKKAVLFGSYVKGTADTRSDVDIMVESNLKGLAFYGLLGEISDVMRFPVDLIEKRTIEVGSDFEKEISKTGVVIYG